MIKLFKHNLILKCISLLLALGLWLFVMNEQNPSITNTVTVPLSILNAPDNYQISHEEDSVKIRVKAPRTLFAAVNNADFKAYVDLKNVKEGEQSLPVQIQLPGGFEFISSSPEKISFVLDEIIQKQVPVDLITSGRPADGMVVANIEQSADMVTVKGPRSQVDTVSRVVGYIGLDNNKDDFNVKVPLRPVNNDNNDVSDVTLSSSAINVNIALARGLTRKIVTIKPVTMSDLPAGHLLDSVKPTPDKVEITGDPQVISTINSLNTEKISLADVTTSGNKIVKILVPEGVTVANNTINVSIKISGKKTNKN